MRKILSKLLIIGGLLIISSVAYMNYNTNKINENMVNEYKKNMQDNIQYSEVRQDEYNIGDVIGVLNIPKIDLEVAIKRGIEKEVLKDAVGHFENSAMPGEYGNFAVAGHRAYTNNKFFSNLDELEIGDELNVLTQGKTHTYKVNHIEVVEPEQVEVVESINQEIKEITLVTCTPKYIGSHRLIVKGIYIEKSN